MSTSAKRARASPSGRLTRRVGAELAVDFGRVGGHEERGIGLNMLGRYGLREGGRNLWRVFLAFGAVLEYRDFPTYVVVWPGELGEGSPNSTRRECLDSVGPLLIAGFLATAAGNEIRVRDCARVRGYQPLVTPAFLCVERSLGGAVTHFGAIVERRDGQVQRILRSHGIRDPAGRSGCPVIRAVGLPRRFLGYNRPAFPPRPSSRPRRVPWPLGRSSPRVSAYPTALIV